MTTSSRVRVLVTVKGLGIGGAERLISEGARFWNRERFDYHVAYALPWKDQLVSDLERLDVPVRCIGNFAGTSIPSLSGMRGLVRRVEPDLIHAHLPTVGVISRLVAKPPVIYTEHNLAGSYHPVTRWANRVTYSRNTATIAVSHAVAASLRGYGGSKPKVIENAVDCRVDPEEAVRARAELGIGADTPLVVQVGNLRPGKGHENLLRAIRVLQAEVPDLVVASIGGEKWPGDLDRVNALAGELGVGRTVRFLGRREDATAFVAAADVFVNPAEVEGLPVAILEAMALGRPIVATAVGGVPGVIKDDYTGLLVPPQSPDRLAAAMQRLLGDHALAKDLGERARHVAGTEYGLERMVRRIESLYEEVVAAHG